MVEEARDGLKGQTALPHGHEMVLGARFGKGQFA
jgi:hypothetical protein